MPLAIDVRLRVRLLASLPAIAACGGLCLPPTQASGAVPVRLADVKGGADFSGHEYIWTVANHHTSPLVYLALPGHNVDLFTGPENWTFEHVASGWVAKAEPDAGIASGHDAAFTMRVNAKGAKRGFGNVIARFRDGTQCVIRDVEVPLPETSADTYMPLFGLAMMMLVVIMLKRKHTREKSMERSG